MAMPGLFYDAFGRLRVSNPETLFDSKQIFDNQPLFWDDQEVSGSGTSSTYSKPAARSRLAVSASTAGKRVRQTFRRFNYQPGKSTLVLMTAKMNTPAAGISAAVGMFDDDNGIFLKMDGTTIKVVRRTSTSGSPVDNEVAQSEVNGDPMDGTGPSGITLDATKTQIIYIDIEWLGVGRVRTGFVIDGQFILFHEFLNTNNLDVVYMSTPNLPLRYEIENDGTGGASNMDHICSTIISEGGQEATGVIRRASTSGTHVTTAVENTLYAVVGLRLKSTHLGAAIRILKFAGNIQSASEHIEWVLLFNPTVAGTFTYSDITNSACQRALGATANTVTGGTQIGGSWSDTGTGASGGTSVSEGVDNALVLGSKIDGTRDTIVLCARPIGGVSAADVEGSIVWRELQ